MHLITSNAAAQWSHHQVDERQAEVEHLRYTLTVNDRRHKAVVDGLQYRLGELDSVLAQNAGETDEYHRVNVQRDLELINLNNQVACLASLTYYR